jgi:hypothetical protein
MNGMHNLKSNLSNHPQSLVLALTKIFQTHITYQLRVPPNIQTPRNERAMDKAPES